jgi:hypothetical protein
MRETRLQIQERTAREIRRGTEDRIRALHEVSTLRVTLPTNSVVGVEYKSFAISATQEVLRGPVNSTDNDKDPKSYCLFVAIVILQLFILVLLLEIHLIVARR